MIVDEVSVHEKYITDAFTTRNEFGVLNPSRNFSRGVGSDPLLVANFFLKWWK